jgi:hypothetical protein
MGSIHTKIVTEGGATMYRRVEQDVIGTSFAAADDIAYIRVDHETRKVVCGSTEEQARQNLDRVRDSPRDIDEEHRR